MDGNKKQKFAASRRRKSGSSIPNVDSKVINIPNQPVLMKTSSNEQVDRYLSASHKKIKSSSNIVAISSKY